MAPQDNKSDAQKQLTKKSLDKDLSRFAYAHEQKRSAASSFGSLGSGLVFLILAGVFATTQIGPAENAGFIIAAAVLGGYMALNIGANDVANNVAPAVGSGALTLMGALVIAAIFETAGALIAGGDVVSTISKGIIDPTLVPDSGTFIRTMMAALLSAALWINLATYLRAPVSTTHSIVGGVIGAGVAAVGFELVNWMTMAKIAASWVISPVLGGIIAVIFLAFIKVNIIYQDDKIAAAKRWVPVLIAIMVSTFSCYLVVKGLKRVWQPDYLTIGGSCTAVFLAALLVLRPLIAKQAEGLENRNQSLRKLFHWPLIFSAALLSFAHGSNDVANAIGPLSAILHSASSGVIAAKVGIPFWIMFIGATGIAAGLFLYGPRLIRTVGEQITRMNPMRAYCVALSAAITVIIASALGLPVSSTHIAVGAVFGVGFFREYYTSKSARRRNYVQQRAAIENGNNVKTASKKNTGPSRKPRKLVRRSHFMTIIAAWLITVPAAAILAGCIYLILSYFA